MESAELSRDARSMTSDWTSRKATSVGTASAGQRRVRQCIERMDIAIKAALGKLSADINDIVRTSLDVGFAELPVTLVRARLLRSTCSMTFGGVTLPSESCSDFTLRRGHRGGAIMVVKGSDGVG